MGGPNSGRHADPVKRLVGFGQPMPTGNDSVYLPNYSGVQDKVLKTAPAITTFAAGDLTASGAGIIVYGGVGAVSGSGTQISVSSTGTETDPIFNAASSAYNVHLADTTDPHGTLLTQTYFSLASGAITNDHTASGAAVIRNILIGTEASSALVAASYPEGTIYLRYS